MAKKSDKIDTVLRQTSQILKNQKKILKQQQQLISEEEQELREEYKIERQEEQELEELHKIRALEKNIKKEVGQSPLKRITIRDVSKSIIGAFIGIMGHFSFFYGVKIAHDISMSRATVLYIVSFIIGTLFVYFAGYRKVSDKKFMRFIPLRIFAIYFTSLLVIVFVLYLFGFLTTQHHFTEIYKTVSTISILAVLGAATADLIGKSE